MASNGFRLSAELDVVLGSDALATIRKLKSELQQARIDVKIGIPKDAGRSMSAIVKQMKLMNEVLPTLNVRLISFGNILRNIPTQSFTDIRKTVEELRALKESMKGIGKDSYFANAFKTSSQQLGQVKKELKSANSEIERLKPFKNRLQNIRSEAISAQKALSSIGTATREFDGAATRIANLESKVRDFGRQSALAFKRFGAFAVVTSGVFRLQSALATSVRQAIDFQNQMVRLQQVSKSTGDVINGVSETITEAATNYGVLSKELSSAAVTLAQTGISADRVKIALDAIALTDLAPTFNNINQTTEASIAILAQFGLEVEELKESLGSINAVSAAFAVESEDIAIAIRKAGGAFAAAGSNLNELIALFTSVRATSRESADTIATALRTIIARLQRVETQDYLLQFGIELRDDENQFVGPFEAIRKISQALKDVPTTDPIFAQIVEKIGGVRQLSKVIPLIKQNQLALDAYSVAQAGANSLDQERLLSQKSIERQFIKTREAFDEMVRAFINDDSVQTMIAQFLELTRAALSFATALKDLASVLPFFAIAGISRFAVPFVKGFVNGKTQSSPISSLVKNPSKVLRRATGGNVPGVGNKDNVLALLTPGEFVLNKKAAQALGKDELERLNDLPKFASGGLVGSLTKNLPKNSKNLGSIAAGTIAVAAITNFDEASDSVKELGIAAASAAVQFYALKGIGAIDTGGVSKLDTKLEKIDARIAKDNTKISDLKERRDTYIARVGQMEQARIKAQNVGDVTESLRLRDEMESLAREISPQKDRAGNVIKSRRGFETLDEQISTQERIRDRRTSQVRGAAARQQRNLRITNAAAIGGIAATVAGGAIQDYGMNQIRETGEGQGAAVFGGALSGAGQGAALGAIGGPWGAAAGFFIGGLIGMTSALGEAETEIKNFKFNKSFSEASRILEGNLAGDIPNAEAFTKLNAGARAATTRLAGTTGQDRALISGNINNQLPKFAQFLGKAAEESDSMEELVKNTKDVIELVALMRDIPVEEVIKEMEKIKTSFEESKKITDALNKDFLALQRVIRSSQIVQKMYDKTLSEIDKTVDSLDNKFNLANSNPLSISQVDIQKAFDDALKGNITDDFKNIVNNVSGSLGDAGPAFQDRVTESTKAIAAAEEIFLKLAESGGVEEGDFVDRVISEFEKVTSNQEVLDKIQASFGSTRESNLEKLKNGEELPEQLRKALEPMVDVGREMAEKFQEGVQVLESLLDRRSQTIENINSLRQRQDNVLLGADNFERELNRNPRTIAETAAIDDASLYNNLAGNAVTRGIDTSSPTIVADLMRTREESENRLNDIQSRINRGTGGAEEELSLRKARREEEEAIKNVSQALEQLSGESLSLQEAQAKLSAKMSQRFDFGSNFVFGTSQQRREQASSFRLANRASTTNSLSGIASSRREDVRSIFRSLSSVKAFDDGQGNKITGEDAERRLVLEEIKKVNPQLGKNLTLQDIVLPGKEEAALLEKIRSENEKQTNAIEALIKIQQDYLAEVDTATNEIPEALNKSKEVGRLDSDIANLNSQIERDRAAQEPLSKQKGKIEGLRELGLSDSDIEALGSEANRKAIEENERLLKQEEALNASIKLFKAERAKTTGVAETVTGLALGPLGAPLSIERASDAVDSIAERTTGTQARDEGGLFTDLNRNVAQYVTPNLDPKEAAKFSDDLRKKFKDQGVDDSYLPSPQELNEAGIGGEDSIDPKRILDAYASALKKAVQVNNESLKGTEQKLFDAGLDPTVQQTYFTNKEELKDFNLNGRKYEDVVKEEAILKERIDKNEKARGLKQDARDLVLPPVTPPQIPPGNPRKVDNLAGLQLIDPNGLGSTNRINISEQFAANRQSQPQPREQFESLAKGFDVSFKDFDKTTMTFNNSVSQFEKATANIPSNISMEGTHKVEVVINGAEAFKNMEASITNLVTTEINKGINRFMKNNLKMPGTFEGVT